MKTALQQAIKEIAELWSSPSDQPTYTQIFNILESKLPIEKQQIAIANSSRCYFYSCEETKEQIKELHHSGDVSKLYDSERNCLSGRCGNNCIFQNGTWATIIKPKQMTQEEIEKELGYKIEII